MMTPDRLKEIRALYIRDEEASDIVNELLDEIERLSEALRPFAQMAKEAEPYAECRETYLANAISFYDCQRARKVLGDE